jgi:preprotein translocase subunit SecG
MYILVTVIHIIVSLFLVVVVLLQSGKAADLSAAFGGQGSQTVFGPRGSATVLTRATTISAILFMITSLSLSVMSTGAASAPTLLDEVAAPAAETTASPGATKDPGPIKVTTEIEGGGKQTTEIPQATPPAPKQ